MIAKREIIDQKEFHVIGISVRTSNKNGQAQKDIGVLWEKFVEDGLIDKIDNKASDDIYCVYTGYESDYTGSYVVILGYKVNCLERVAMGLTDITIPADKYLVHSLKNEFPANIGTAWQQIWSSDIDRKYTADYDVYSSRPKNFEETEAKIYLAVN